MALYDWNHNGTKDIADNYMEYRIYKQPIDYSEHIPNSGGISIFGAILALILGLLSTTGIIALLGGGNDLFVILTILLWLICSGVLSVCFDIIGL